MKRKYFDDETGQAVAEFCMALLVLLPLVFWTFRLGALLHLKHETIANGRFATWEKAYGRDEHAIDKMIQNDLQNNAMLIAPAQIKVKSGVSAASSRDDLVALLDVPDGLKLNRDGYQLSEVRVRGKLLLGIDFELSDKSILLADPWNLTDRNNNRRIDDEDLADAVDGIYFWVPGIGKTTSGAIRAFWDSFEGLQRKIRNLPLVGWLLRLSGHELDIDPRGHPRLDVVPQPSGN